MKTIAETLRPLAVGLFVFAIPIFAPAGIAAKSPVNYVNPYIGNVSHLLVPTFPTVHLPNSMLLVYPQRSAFNISPTSGAPASPVAKYNYDNEHIAPYCYSVELGDNSIRADYAPSHQSAVYALHFNDGNPYIAISTPSAGFRPKAIMYRATSNSAATPVYISISKLSRSPKPSARLRTDATAIAL